MRDALFFVVLMDWYRAVEHNCAASSTHTPPGRTGDAIKVAFQIDARQNKQRNTNKTNENPDKKNKRHTDKHAQARNLKVKQ